MLLYFLTVFDLVYKDLGRLKAWNVVFVNYQRCVPGNVARNFPFALLVDEAAKSPDIDVIAI